MIAAKYNGMKNLMVKVFSSKKKVFRSRKRNRKYVQFLFLVDRNPIKTFTVAVLKCDTVYYIGMGPLDILELNAALEC